MLDNAMMATCRIMPRKAATSKKSWIVPGFHPPPLKQLIASSSKVTKISLRVGWKKLMKEQPRFCTTTTDLIIKNTFRPMVVW